MRTLSILLAVLFVASVGFSQATPGARDFVFIPKTLSVGTLMSARAFSSAYDDTTQAISLDGWNRVFVTLVTAANDSISVICSYSGSMDGSTFGQYNTLDSLSSTGTTGVNDAFELPAAAMGFQFVRVRLVYSSIGRASANPSTTLTTYIRKKRR